MNLLLDTHVLIWWMTNDSRLSKNAVKAIAEGDVVYVSAASAWEIEVKRQRGLLNAPDDLAAAFVEKNLQPLALTIPHMIASARFPFHHRDPFDRMLVAQASLENLTLCTADAMLARYEVPVLLV